MKTLVNGILQIHDLSIYAKTIVLPVTSVVRPVDQRGMGPVSIFL